MHMSIKMTDGEKSNTTTVITITLHIKPTAEAAITHTHQCLKFSQGDVKVLQRTQGFSPEQTTAARKDSI